MYNTLNPKLDHIISIANTVTMKYKSLDIFDAYLFVTILFIHLIYIYCIILYHLYIYIMFGGELSLSGVENDISLKVCIKHVKVSDV